MPRFKENQREEYRFIDASLDELLPGNSVARAIWAGLEKLDFSRFDAAYNNEDAGCTAVDPRCLTAVWMLSLLRGVQSSVRVARLCATDIEFRWLMGGAGVEKSTLAAFRKERKEALADLSAQILTALGVNGLLPGEHLGVDGTVVRAASSRHAVKSRRRLEARIGHVKQLLDERLSRPDSDAEENDGLARRQTRLEEALDMMTARGLKHEKDKMNTTEPDAPLRRQKNGSYAPGYNVQAVPDLDTGAIVSAEVVDAGNDAGQLEPQVERAEDALRAARADAPDGEASRISEAVRGVAADGAYHDTLQLKNLEERGVECYVPDNRNANRKAPGATSEYQAEAFRYDPDEDCMYCPEGEPMTRQGLNNGKTAAEYKAKAKTCAVCPAKQHCCPKSNAGRTVNRPLYPEVLAAVAGRLETEQGRWMKRARWCSEGVFSRLLHGLSWRRCHMWNRAGAEMELLWRQATHNFLLLTGVWKPLKPKTT